MDHLKKKVLAAMQQYITQTDDLKMIFLSNEDQAIYAINVIDTPVRFYPAAVVMLVRVVEDYILIEEDISERPLLDVLLEMDIPRQQIILAYAGERVPQSELEAQFA